MTTDFPLRQPLSACVRLFSCSVCSDEDYNMITRGRLLDRMRVALAGSAAVRLVLGEETNFAIADIKRVRRMAERFVFYYGMSDFGLTTWAQQPYSHDFAVGSNRCDAVHRTPVTVYFSPDNKKRAVLGLRYGK
jgi:ATP-dependent Zn protease